MFLLCVILNMLFLFLTIIPIGFTISSLTGYSFSLFNDKWKRETRDEIMKPAYATFFSVIDIPILF